MFLCLLYDIPQKFSCCSEEFNSLMYVFWLQTRLSLCSEVKHSDTTLLGLCWSCDGESTFIFKDLDSGTAISFALQDFYYILHIIH